jgi:hypothetical protein
MRNEKTHLSVDEEVHVDLLLELDNRLDLVLDEGLVLLGGKFTLGVLGTGETDLLGLREGTDGGGSCRRAQGIVNSHSSKGIEDHER